MTGRHRAPHATHYRGARSRCCTSRCSASVSAAPTKLLELPAGATVGRRDRRSSPRCTRRSRQLAGRFRVAVNHEMVDDARVLADGDELALIPPVAGGSGRHVVLADEPLSLDRCIAAVSAPGMGGIVTFTGMVRDHSRGATIQRLEYEAYAPMAVRVMTRAVRRDRSRAPRHAARRRASRRHARGRRARGRDRRRGAASRRGVRRVPRDDRSAQGSRADLEERDRRARRVVGRARPIALLDDRRRLLRSACAVGCTALLAAAAQAPRRNARGPRPCRASSRPASSRGFADPRLGRLRRLGAAGPA